MPSTPPASWACTAGVKADASRIRLNRTERNGDKRSFIRNAHCPIRMSELAANCLLRTPQGASPPLRGSNRTFPLSFLFDTRMERSGRREAVSSTGERVEEKDHRCHQIQ